MKVAQTNQQILDLQAALQRLDGYSVKEVVAGNLMDVQKFYKIPANTRFRLAQLMTVVSSLVGDFNTARINVLNELSGGLGVIADGTQEYGKFHTDIAKLLVQSVEVQLPKGWSLSEDSLNLASNEAAGNEVPMFVIMALLPFLCPPVETNSTLIQS